MHILHIGLLAFGILLVLGGFAFLGINKSNRMSIEDRIRLMGSEDISGEAAKIEYQKWSNALSRIPYIETCTMNVIAFGLIVVGVAIFFLTR